MPAPLITIEQARAAILERVPAPGAEPAAGSSSRWAGCWPPMSSPRADTPPFPSSAMDGYAVQPGRRAAG